MQESVIFTSFTNVPLRLVSEILKECFPASSFSEMILAWSLDIITLFWFESRNMSEEAGFLPTIVISLFSLWRRNQNKPFLRLLMTGACLQNNDTRQQQQCAGFPILFVCKSHFVPRHGHQSQKGLHRIKNQHDAPLHFFFAA